MKFQRIALVILAFTLSMSAMADSSSAASNAQSIAGVAQACYSGFVSSIPPSFCYKKGGDVGTIPTACSSGYFRSLALCYADCGSGYYFTAGVCWESCGSGYRDDGLSCYRSLFNWYFKRSYIPSSYTNFDSRAACSPGLYKSGALCYRDCSQIGLLNCGIGACAATTASCASTIATMVIDELISLGQAVAFVASFGTDSGATVGIDAAKSTVSDGFEKLGSGAVTSALDCFKDVIQREGSEAFIKQVTDYAADNIAKFTGQTIAMGTLITVCQNVGNQMLSKINQSTGPSINWQNFDPTGISSAVSSCSTVSSTNDQIACAQAVLNSVAIVDPTGIVGMAAAVLQPICNGV